MRNANAQSTQNKKLYNVITMVVNGRIQKLKNNDL